MIEYTHIDGLLIESTDGGHVGVPGWITAPTLHDALFAVVLVQGRYNISHQPTKRALPGSYTSLDDAAEVCSKLCSLLADDDAWWDPFRLVMPGQIADWIRANPQTRAEMKRIAEQPASYQNDWETRS